VGRTEAARRAIVSTGAVISNCGLIMAATLGSLWAGGLSLLQQTGFSLALGVLIDTFLVRPILIPSFFLAVGRPWADDESAGFRGSDRSPVSVGTILQTHANPRILALADVQMASPPDRAEGLTLFLYRSHRPRGVDSESGEGQVVLRLPPTRATDCRSAGSLGR